MQNPPDCFPLCVAPSPEPPPPIIIVYVCACHFLSVPVFIFFSFIFLYVNELLCEKMKTKKKFNSGKIFELFCYSFLVFVCFLLTRERAKNLKKTLVPPPP